MSKCTNAEATICEAIARGRGSSKYEASGQQKIGASEKHNEVGSPSSASEPINSRSWLRAVQC